ncbi:hypothetical protein Gotri_002998 [Gossypium trilobum]|uniref:Uncharacterized protein n=1 Tax=Gossypium trilobum TaxID=34281 RepID=A0A7J9FC54_9ROSI|nr:hypothetical protein [Gossypium trilobum]
MEANQFRENEYSKIERE